MQIVPVKFSIIIILYKIQLYNTHLQIIFTRASGLILNRAIKAWLGKWIDRYDVGRYILVFKDPQKSNKILVSIVKSNLIVQLIGNPHYIENI